MPENLPTPEKSLKTLDKERKRTEKLLEEEKPPIEESLLSTNKISEVIGIDSED